MLCNYCHGTRLVQIAGATQPCPECGGHGSLHCCDGLQAQPEPEQALTQVRSNEEALATS
jgi:hypothetical protein